MGRSVRQVVATVFAVAMSVVSSLVVFGMAGFVPGQEGIDATWLSGLSLLAGLAAAVLLCWRHRWPVLVTGIALVAPLLLASDSFAALVALAALAASRRDWLVWLGTGLVFTATALAVWRDAGRHPDARILGQLMGTDTTAGKVVGVLVLTVVLTGTPLAVGIVRRTRRELASRESEERALREEVARRQERSRIAHEMHDVLGHRLSLLSLQAGALEVSAPEAGEAARSVRTSARQSLDDLRQVIGVLREGSEFPGRAADSPDSPTPTLAEVPDLVERTRRAGVPVNLTILLDQAGEAPAQLGTAVYRIVQESLTNVLRHAPGAPADLVVRGGPGAGVAVEVTNPLPAERVPSPGSGTGLAGMSERVSVLGGTVSAGPTDRGTFTVRAWLPWAVH
ncbi:sensor histidine kinase [Actinophytocola gossypii]|uniref:histidine kinase n=1 Tax=Actinophytocola gossypii TaxID=2812003 RepID=A0ABT2J6T4_9PSEU|nr:histidine kinase [Actinophytocola gossypii]MCT2583572.1 two-component sensor histidine kinase [Actinophytocola gossypii]